MSNFEDVIAPPKKFISIDWRELWRFRDLFLVFAWRDIAVRYKQTALGVLWAIFQPFINMVIFSYIFGTLLGLSSGDGTPYPIFLFVGQLFWIYFSGTLSNASNSMVLNAQLVQKIYFPRLIVPATAATTGLVDLSISGFVMIGIMAYYGFKPHLIGLLILPILLVTIILASMGMGLYLAAINVKYRDVRYALPFFITSLQYLTPIIYPVKILDDHPLAKTLMLWLNPISGVVTNARAGIIGNSPIDWNAMGISFTMSLVFFICGLYYFRNTERYFADIV
ncbi:MAG: ABC transporter permease [Armatimonadetes bacterium]|nr:ABC transporter permease [Armatimonadota bacterium]